MAAEQQAAASSVSIQRRTGASRMRPISSQNRASVRGVTLGARPPRPAPRPIMSTSGVDCASKILLSSDSSKRNLFKPTYSSKLAFLAIVTFTSILLLTCLVNQQVSSLNCYTCSSAVDPGCDESFSGRANITDTDCVKHIGRQATVCRKIVQYLEDKKVVIRACGWIDDHEDKKPICFKRSGTFALMMESCNCYEDNCNHSTSLVPNQSVSILLAAGSMIFYYLLAGQRDRLH